MLPFLNKDEAQDSGVIQKTRAPDKKPESEQEDSSAGMEAVAHDLIRAIHSRDVKAVADAIKAAFEIADSEPHAEGPHTNEGE